jgi:hypothetical protein
VGTIFQDGYPEVRFEEIIQSREATCPTSPHPGVEAIARGDPFLRLLG